MKLKSEERERYYKQLTEDLEKINEKWKNETFSDEEFDTLMMLANPMYCPVCGSCGIDGCCSPTRCLYVETSQASYDHLVAENNRYQSFIKELSNNKFLLEFGYDMLHKNEKEYDLKMKIFDNEDDAIAFIKEEYKDSFGYFEKNTYSTLTFFNKDNEIIAQLI